MRESACKTTPSDVHRQVQAQCALCTGRAQTYPNMVQVVYPGLFAQLSFSHVMGIVASQEAQFGMCSMSFTRPLYGHHHAIVSMHIMMSTDLLVCLRTATDN